MTFSRASRSVVPCTKYTFACHNTIFDAPRSQNWQFRVLTLRRIKHVMCRLSHRRFQSHVIYVQLKSPPDLPEPRSRVNMARETKSRFRMCKKKMNAIDRFLRRSATRKNRFFRDLRRLMAEKWQDVSADQMGTRLKENAIYFLKSKKRDEENH